MIEIDNMLNIQILYAILLVVIIIILKFWLKQRKIWQKYNQLNTEFQQQENVQKFVVIAFQKYSKLFEKSKITEKIIPREIHDEEDLLLLATNLDYSKNHDLQSIKRAISDPIYDILNRGGKRIRPVFCGLFAESFGKKFNDVIEIAGMIEILHNASLIIDDIEDKGYMRRDKPTIHRIYGEDISINAGNLAYFAPLNYLYKNQDKFGDKKMLKLSKIYAEEMTQIHLGQAWDIEWHSHKNESFFPSEDQYLQMVVFKTGVLFRMMSRMVCAIIGTNKKQEQALSTFCEKIGAAFQIQDDILSVDIDKSDFSKTKGIVGEDIYEGKITLMVIHLLRESNKKDRERFIQILKLKTNDENLIMEAINLMKKYKSIEYSKQYAIKAMEDAWQSLDKVLAPNEAKIYIKAICQYVIDRTR